MDPVQNDRNQQALPWPNEVSQQNLNQQQPENGSRSNATTFHIRPCQPRSKADKRRAQRERRRLYGKLPPQRLRSPEPGRPTPVQTCEQDDSWLAEFVKKREENRQVEEQQAVSNYTTRFALEIICIPVVLSQLLARRLHLTHVSAPLTPLCPLAALAALLILFQVFARMSKRQRIEEEVKLLEDRRKALEQQLLHENEEEELDESEVSSGRSSSVDSPSESESETDTASSEPKKRKKGETPLKPALLEVLGDPEASRNLRLPINSKLIECWKIFMAKGLPAEEKEKIFKRYQVAEGLDAPKLNQALIPRLPEKTTKKDAYRQEVQSLISLALSTLSAAITMINEADAEDGLDEKVFTGRLMDTAKLLAEAQFSQTQSRRACIVPVFDKKLRQTLKDTTPDDRLFGTDLTNLIKQVKDIEALFDCSSKRAGNFKSAFEKKTPLSAQSVTRTLQKVREDRAEGIIVVPDWRNQPWYPLFLRLIEKSKSKSKAFGSSGRDHIREAFKALKVPTESLDIMLASLSVSTRKHYKASIAWWLIFCEENSLNIYKAKPRDLINFLTERFRQGTQTLARWVRNIMKEAGIDTQIFKAHSTRHAASSAAYDKGLSIDVIKERAGWSKDSKVFARYYNRPIVTDSNDLSAVLLAKKK
ncbi:hypothetical protein TKK_0014330 [Trichogramma kaykai]